MNEQDLKHIIEATLLAAGKPVTTEQLLELFEERERPTPELMKAALSLLAVDYEPRGIELVEVASGWRVQVRPRAAEVVSRLWQERPSRYSRAFLETLALIAYRQPITRSEIEEIRGVTVSSTIMRTLQERNWIRTVGHREVPGRPELLGTTRDFLDYFGLKSLDQLPTLAELKDVETIGVQLELPSGDAAPAEGSDEAAAETVASSESEPADATAEPEADTDEETDSETVAESSDGDGNIDDANDDSELSADAEDGDEDSDASPIMVASSDEEEHDRNRIGEPPSES
jgi:segregation and condensation protein B